jgi:hypothetical protein
VFVEIRSDNPSVRIDRVVGGQYVPVCLTPCRRWLPRSEVYVINGEGVRSTGQFMLPDDRQQVTLEVHAGSSSQLSWGVVLVCGGLGVGYLGLFLIDAGALENTGDGFSGNGSSGNGKIAAGSALLLGGLVAAGIGFFVAVTSHTTVVSSTGNSFSWAPETPTRPRKRSRIAITPRGLEF